MAVWQILCIGSDHVPKIVVSDTEPTYTECPICGNTNIKIVKLSD